MTVQEEAQFAAPIREFTKMLNRRMSMSGQILEGSLWVRIRPPTMQEAEMAQEDHRTLPFLRVGSVGVVVGVVVDSKSWVIDLSIAGDRLLIEREEFLSTWTRVVEPDEWKKSQEVWRREAHG